MTFNQNNCNDTPCTECNDCVDTPEIVCPPLPTYLEDPTIDSSDIQYLGNTDNCVPVTKFSTITLAISNIVNFIKSKLFNITSTSLVVTNPTNNLCNKVLNIEVVPSIEAGNILRLGTDNKPYVPTVLSGLQDINILNSDCITFTKTVINSVPTFTPTINMACIAAQICPLCQSAICPNPSNLQIN